MNDKDTNNAIALIDKEVNRSKVESNHDGLPKEIFLLSSRLSPILNVDLLIKDETGRVLLSWRDDPYVTGPGWHIPGGIVRLKEKMTDRVQKVAMSEIGTIVDVDPIPIDYNELITERTTRGHFFSVLYECFLSKKFKIINNLNETDPGYLKWHDCCPDNLIPIHSVYQKWFKNE